MKILFSQNAWNDYLFWQKNDSKTLKRINLLIKETKHKPYVGIGKPEALKHSLSGFWSRRINNEHRMVYKMKQEILCIVQLRYHY